MLIGRAGALPLRAALVPAAAVSWACFGWNVPLFCAGAPAVERAFGAGRAAEAGAGRLGGRDGPDAAGGGTMVSMMGARSLASLGGHSSFVTQEFCLSKQARAGANVVGGGGEMRPWES